MSEAWKRYQERKRRVARKAIAMQRPEGVQEASEVAGRSHHGRATEARGGQGQGGQGGM